MILHVRIPNGSAHEHAPDDSLFSFILFILSSYSNRTNALQTMTTIKRAPDLNNNVI